MAHPIIPCDGFTIEGSQDVFEAFRMFSGLFERQVFVALLLDDRHDCLGFTVLSVGMPVPDDFPAAEAFRTARAKHAAALILIQNEPGTDATPTPEDQALFERVQQEGDRLGTPVLDQVLIGDGCWYSFADQQLP
jgi:DNA repair protein RadC